MSLDGVTGAYSEGITAERAGSDAVQRAFAVVFERCGLDAAVLIEFQVDQQRFMMIAHEGEQSGADLLAGLEGLVKEVAASERAAFRIEDRGAGEVYNVDAAVRGVARIMQVDGIVLLVAFSSPGQGARAGQAVVSHRAIFDAWRLEKVMVVHQESARSIRRVLSLAGHVLSSDDIHKASLALCNELAAAWSLERVAAGVVRGRAVSVVSVNHAERVDRHAPDIARIAAAMEECADQGEVVDTANTQSLAVSRMAEAAGSGARVVCIPLMVEGVAIGVIYSEVAEDDSSFLRDSVLLAGFVAGHMQVLSRHSGSTFDRLRNEFRHVASLVLGPRYPVAKAVGIALACILLWSLLYPMKYRVSASATIESDRVAVLAAPFRSQVEHLKLQPGDMVGALTDTVVLLDTTEYDLEIADIEADLANRRFAMREVMAEGDASAVAGIQAEIDALTAERDLLAVRREQCKVVSPIAGTVISDEASRLGGTFVEYGQPLATVADLGSMFVRVSVPEDQASDVALGATAQIAPAAFPGTFVDGDVELIEPAARASDGQNAFAVRLSLGQLEPWMRPGMEGTARIEAGRRPPLWIATRRLRNWVRMKLWL